MSYRRELPGGAEVAVLMEETARRSRQPGRLAQAHRVLKFKRSINVNMAHPQVPGHPFFPPTT